MIYSTCTFNPDENEKNIKWLIDKNEAEVLRIDISGYKGIKEIDFQGVYGYGFYPDRVRGEGFFISVMRKLNGGVSKPVRTQRLQELKPSKNDTETATRWSDFSPDRLLRRGDEVIALPCSTENYLNLFHRLSVVTAGTKLFTVKKNDYLPSHDLALSKFIIRGAFPENSSDLKNSLAYLKRNSITLQPENKGWNLLTFEGINLGFVNNIGNRINNYFPVEWRIRMDLPQAGNENLIRWEDYDKGNT